MLNMKNLFCLFLLFLNHTLNAQFADLIKDKNVAWVGESSIDVRLDVLQEKEMDKIYDISKYYIFDGLTVLKFQESKEIEAEEGFDFFTRTLLKAEYNKFITIYSDSLCTQPTDMLSVISRNDPPCVYDSITQEKKCSIVTCHAPISKSYLYRVRHV
jgi:hypothetical protein